MNQPAPQCDLLLFVTTHEEEEALLWACEILDRACERRTDPRLGAYFDLGTLGRQRVLAVRTRMGTIDHQGATSKAVLFQWRTGARGLVATGMAFGVNTDEQDFGDVLVSQSLFPYDRREVVDSLAGPVPDYSRTRLRQANEALLAMIDAETRRESLPFRVSTGTLLSGGARISSRTFRDSLVRGVPDADAVIGGDMEGVGLLAVSPAGDPCWLVVKGISDFAEGRSSATAPDLRQLACRNAVRLVLSSILHQTP